MQINWKLRLKNKVTLISIITLVVAIVYQTLNMFGIIPDIEQQQLLDVLCRIVDLLALLGIVVDPSTAGIGDTKNVLERDEPRRDLLEEINNDG